MYQTSTRLAVAFLVGFVGLLVASALRATGVWVVATPIGLGVIAALLGRRPLALPGLWLGMLAAYPAALALRVFAFLGEGWVIYALLSLSSAGLSFWATLGVLGRNSVQPKRHA
jgi:hypothetical protein